MIHQRFFLALSVLAICATFILREAGAPFSVLALFLAAGWLALRESRKP